jgi:large subunit ribosomal protein L18
MLTDVSRKRDGRKKRHRSIRKRIEGTQERPRLAVFRSARHIYVQVIDDIQKKTLVATSDLPTKADKGSDKGSETKADKKDDKKARAKQVGTLIAKKCLEKGIDKVVFDRAGYKYHGRVSALADGAREAGLKF